MWCGMWHASYILYVLGMWGLMLSMGSEMGGLL